MGELPPKGWTLIEEVYDYIVTTISNSNGTGFIDLSGGQPLIRQLWDDFMVRKITIDQVIVRLRIIKPTLPSESLEITFKR
jgi:hypothetical protein